MKSRDGQSKLLLTQDPKLLLRLATKVDIDDLFLLCKSFNEDAHYGFEIDEAYAKAFLFNHIINPERLSLLLEKDGKVEGALLAICSWHPFLRIRMANELMWWINPSARGKESIRMLDAYEYWAHFEQKADAIYLASTTDERVAKLYARRGYTKKEQAWSRN